VRAAGGRDGDLGAGVLIAICLLKPGSVSADDGGVSIVAILLAAQPGADQQAQAIIVWTLVALAAIATLVLFDRH
jgi:hypothetical protein